MFKVSVHPKPLSSGLVRHVVRWRPQGSAGPQKSVPFDDPGHARLYAGLVYTHQGPPPAEVLEAAGLGFLLGTPPAAAGPTGSAPATGAADPPAAQVGLVDACRAYVAGRTSVQADTREGYVSLIDNHLEEFFGDRPLAGVFRADLAEWQRWCLRRGTSAKTIKNVKVAVLGPVFKRATWPGDHGEPPVRPDNPLQGLDVPTTTRRPARRTVVDGEAALTYFRLAYAVNPDAADVLLAAAATGLRRGELTGLCADRVDTAAGVLYVTRVNRRQGAGQPRGQSRRLEDDTKTPAGERPVPIPDDVAGMFTARVAAAIAAGGPAGLVFPNGRTGGLWLGTAWQRFMTRLHRATDAAGLPRVTAHSWRAAYKSWLAVGGVDPHTQNAALGHTGASGDPYFRLSPAGLAAVRTATAGPLAALATARPAAGTAAA